LILFTEFLGKLSVQYAQELTHTQTQRETHTETETETSGRKLFRYSRNNTTRAGTTASMMKVSFHDVMKSRASETIICPRADRPMDTFTERQFCSIQHDSRVKNM
jgi:hypothetical protein